MASKKDLVEGQSFSRRRLITAFVSGAPGGREVEPGKPLRAVVGGVVLSAILVVGALAAGLLAPTLPDGWDQGSLVIAKDTGARYVALDGTLYPVINTASARLLVPSGFKVVSADSDKLTDSKRGPTLGIVGAPDALPTPDSLVDTGWTSCTSQLQGTGTRIGRSPAATEVSDQAIVATVDGTDAAETYLVDNGFRYRIPSASVVPLRRLLALDNAPEYTVTAEWINLFASAPDVGSFAVPSAGKSLAGVDELPSTATVGQVIADSANQDRPYLLLDGGRIAPLTPFAYAMYRINADTGGTNDRPVPVPGATFADLGRADPVWPSAWPTEVPTPLSGVPCALLNAGTGGIKPTVKLAASSDDPPDNRTTSVVVDPGAGALVRAIGVASITNGAVFLVDQTGVKFPVQSTDQNSDPVSQLGFSRDDIVPVPQAWTALLDDGPTLSVADARKAVSAAGAGK
ncbi:type VII secretion protein EccB [Jatrophihabitans sp. YIM 134969]